VSLVPPSGEQRQSTAWPGLAALNCGCSARNGKQAPLSRAPRPSLPLQLAAARFGAPAEHDFCKSSLSDRLHAAPWPFDRRGACGLLGLGRFLWWLSTNPRSASAATGSLAEAPGAAGEGRTNRHSPVVLARHWARQEEQVSLQPARRTSTITQVRQCSAWCWWATSTNPGLQDGPDRDPAAYPAPENWGPGLNQIGNDRIRTLSALRPERSALNPPSCAIPVGRSLRHQSTLPPTFDPSLWGSCVLSCLKHPNAAGWSKLRNGSGVIGGAVAGTCSPDLALNKTVLSRPGGQSCPRTSVKMLRQRATPTLL